MQINECEIFQKNRANEFEWREIREAARAYIEKNIQNFPIRFEIVQPLRLSEYDFEQQAYKIWEPYQVDSVRMFEVLSAAYGHGWCGSSYEIKGYPKGLVFEFTRPLSITHIKMTPEEAKQFSETKMRGLPSGASTKAVYNSRDAYLVMNIKAYGYKGILKEMQVDPKAKILAALESYSIYADKDRQNLMFSETLRRKEGGKSAEEMLKNRVLENREKERLKEEKRKQKEAERKAQEEEVQEAKNKKSKR
ncbi:MAG: DUF4852 domain-containing protein [Alphaproteobacteria bacterium]|nr:DUF4852 domain-containing protein [Alphaproteobacteria bacterium]